MEKESPKFWVNKKFLSAVLVQLNWFTYIYYETLRPCEGMIMCYNQCININLYNDYGFTDYQIPGWKQCVP